METSTTKSTTHNDNHNQYNCYNRLTGSSVGGGGVTVGESTHIGVIGLAQSAILRALHCAAPSDIGMICSS